MRWGREAQDKEYQHLRLIDAKLREDGVELPRRLSRPMPGLMAGSWALASRTLSVASMRRAILFNAEAEDHAEHYYAELVVLHPEWEDEPATGAAVRDYGERGELGRRLPPDRLGRARPHERQLRLRGLPEHIVSYEGMPPTPGLE